MWGEVGFVSVYDKRMKTAVELFPYPAGHCGSSMSSHSSSCHEVVPRSECSRQLRLYNAEGTLKVHTHTRRYVGMDES